MFGLSLGAPFIVPRVIDFFGGFKNPLEFAEAIQLVSLMISGKFLTKGLEKSVNVMGDRLL